MKTSQDYIYNKSLYDESYPIDVDGIVRDLYECSHDEDKERFEHIMRRVNNKFLGCFEEFDDDSSKFGWNNKGKKDNESGKLYGNSELNGQSQSEGRLGRSIKSKSPSGKRSSLKGSSERDMFKMSGNMNTVPSRYDVLSGTNGLSSLGGQSLREDISSGQFGMNSFGNMGNKNTMGNMGNINTMGNIGNMNSVDTMVNMDSMRNMGNTNSKGNMNNLSNRNNFNNINNISNRNNHTMPSTFNKDENLGNYPHSSADKRPQIPRMNNQTKKYTDVHANTKYYYPNQHYTDPYDTNDVDYEPCQWIDRANRSYYSNGFNENNQSNLPIHQMNNTYTSEKFFDEMEYQQRFRKDNTNSSLLKFQLNK